MLIIYNLLLTFLMISCKSKHVQQANSKMETQSDSLGVLFALDTSSSILYWKGSSLLSVHNGLIKFKDGEFFLHENKITKGKFIIDMSSLSNLDLDDVEEKKELEQHLKNPDFFSVDSFPYIEFSLQGTGFSSDSIHKSLVRGDLKIKDKTQPIELVCSIIPSQQSVMISVPGLILDRTRWGLIYSSKSWFSNLGDHVIDDEIGISMKIIAKRQAIEKLPRLIP